MRVPFRFAALACAAAGMAMSSGTAPSGADPPALEALLERAAWYLDAFIDEFENVVAEETYVQDASTPLPSYTPMPGRGGGKSPETAALVPFRDVIEVDGVPVRDRQDRLARLFLNARYNLGNMRSTIGNPVLALAIMQTAYQPRFKFTLGKEERSAAGGVAANVWSVDYLEVSSPAMVKGEAGRDLFAHGRIWMEAATGRVLKTTLMVEQPAVRAQITTAFRFDDRFGIAVPSEMREQYNFGSGAKLTMVASYGKFRRFDVRPNERVHVPNRLITDALTGMAFVHVPAGRFTMGSPSSEAGRNADETLHDVTITRPFWLARHEVTQQEWHAVMGASPSTFGGCGPRCPVETVSYDDVERFLSALNAKTHAPGDGTPSLHFRLPTEAEWEYACRAGTTGAFSTGDTLSTNQANFNGRYPYAGSSPGEYRQHPVAVGSFPLNPWGLADMHGNVWEWTSDWYGPIRDTPADNIDPRGPASGDKRVIRGGSWYFDANSARCALRYTHAPADKGFSLGFRVAADAR